MPRPGSTKTADRFNQNYWQGGGTGHCGRCIRPMYPARHRANEKGFVQDLAVQLQEQRSLCGRPAIAQLDPGNVAGRHATQQREATPTWKF